MPPRKRTSSMLNGEGHESTDDVESTGTQDARSLAEQADAAEIEAAEAEALAAAARARTRALQLRRQAEEAAAVEARAASAAASASTVEKSTDTARAAGSAAEDAEDAEDVDGLVDVELPAEAADEPASQRRLPWLKIVAATVVVLLSLALLGVSGWGIVHHRNAVAADQRSAEFAAAARQGVVTLMSLDFTRADEDVKRILNNTTGDFRKDFESQAPEFTKVAKESKVVTEATVKATAVDAMTRDTATVLVAVTTDVSNAASNEQQPRSWRLMVDVARDGGQIKMAKVEFVP